MTQWNCDSYDVRYTKVNTKVNLTVPVPGTTCIRVRSQKLIEKEH
jgi:hypothetical protein